MTIFPRDSFAFTVRVMWSCRTPQQAKAAHEWGWRWIKKYGARKGYGDTWDTFYLEQLKFIREVKTNESI